ncbi:PA domain-containing protein [Faunimonas pinastri]|uniref:PA domain-containing protein n=1 Tax=Faunimonas pinastri TaxID=1855383 RepID=A0A1H9AK82_9HYPH|nr:M28 family peptidase [Faunimonas pinastri]SEP77069.1 PA domain-containing protein [Faunimonas pinastri]
MDQMTSGNPGQDAATLEQIADEVDRERLMAHMREFARRVKLSGTPEELESFLYLQEQMKGFGYRTELLSHDAYISLPGKSRVEEGSREIRSITHSMSVPTAGGPVTAELVYVGEGTEELISRQDVRGKILLIDGIAFEDVAAAASKAGALGELHVSPTELLYEMCVSPVWGSPSQHTKAQLPSTVICTISRDDGAALRERVQAGESVCVTLETEVDTGWRKTPLLVCEIGARGGEHGGDLEGGASSDPFILFSGHHDTWHFGVMDNGGANATMLEASRILAAHRQDWQRGLRVCFWSGHSHGRYSGSAWYADDYWHDLERRCAAHVNVDSTGGAGADVLGHSGVIDELKALAADEIAAVSGQLHEGRRQGRAADQSFWGVGIPSMFGSLSHHPQGALKMPVALGPWWHTPEDLIEHIDPDNLVRDTKIALRVLWRLLAETVLPLRYTAYAQALADELDRIDGALAGRLPLDDLKRAVGEIRHLASEIETGAESLSGAAARKADAALMRASRALVPLNYTSGERFHHDPAVPSPGWLGLQGIRDLAGLEAGSPETLFYTVHARQTRNRVAHALHQAREALAAAL